MVGGGECRGGGGGKGCGGEGVGWERGEQEVCGRQSSRQCPPLNQPKAEQALRKGGRAAPAAAAKPASSTTARVQGAGPTLPTPINYTTDCPTLTSASCSTSSTVSQRRTATGGSPLCRSSSEYLWGGMAAAAAGYIGASCVCCCRMPGKLCWIAHTAGTLPSWHPIAVTRTVLCCLTPHTNFNLSQHRCPKLTLTLTLTQASVRILLAKNTDQQ